MDGWVKLYRQIITNGWFQNHKVLIFWIYSLLKATHKDFDAVVGCQKIPLLPGQFIFGLRVAAEETGLSIREIRTCIALLKKWKNLTIKTTNKFSIISIVNWGLYQGEDSTNDKQNDKQTTSKRQHTRTKEHKKKDPGAISEEISSLVSKIFSFPGGEETFSTMIEAVSQTRKAGRVSQGVILSFLQKLEKHPQEKIKAGVQTYLDREYWREGKNEKYLLGIIRNQKEIPPPKNSSPGNGSPKKGDDLAAARRREMETAQAVPPPPGLRPDFLKEGEP